MLFYAQATSEALGEVLVVSHLPLGPDCTKTMKSLIFEYVELYDLPTASQMVHMTPSTPHIILAMHMNSLCTMHS
jgi:hypothetical protein